MSLPKPEFPLQNSCSTIYRNKLYTYSASAFQVLPLTQDAEWKTLQNGVAVDGAVCVHAVPADGSPEALYIVGGVAGAADVTYQGLQKYIYSEDRWETIQLKDPVTHNRLNHNADYLPQHSAILLFSGNQDGSTGPSSQTFTLDTKNGYELASHPSEAPPVISPLMVAWTADQAAMLGGTDGNTRVMAFGLDRSWFDTGCTLPAPLTKDSKSIKATMMFGDDGSKQLYLFDMTESPNKVTRVTCVDGAGTPVNNAEGAPAKRQLTSDNWPEYNSTFAPTSTRQSYSIAQGSDGLVVISGGNDAEPLTIFNMKENSWVNATARLGPQIVLEDESSTSTSSTSSASSTSASTTLPVSSSTSPTVTPTMSVSPTATAAPEESEDGFNFAVLGIVLGSIIGFCLLIVAVILCIKRSRKKGGSPEDGRRKGEKEMDFADRGLSNGPSKRYPKRHEASHSQASVSSTAILMGKVSSSPPQPPLGRGHGSKGSDSSSAFNKSYKSAISKPIPQTGLAPSTSFSRPQQRPPVVGGGGPIMLPRQPSNAGNQKQDDETRRSSGWNRYWSGGSALNMMGFGNKRTTYGSQQSDRESVYSNDGGMPPKLNTSVPGISFGHSGRLSQVASGSPTIYQAKGYPLEQGMSGQIARTASVSSVSSYGDHRDEFSSGVPTSEESQKAWTPFGGSDWNNRAASSVYTDNSFNQPTPRGTLATGAKQQPESSDMSWLNLGR